MGQTMFMEWAYLILYLVTGLSAYIFLRKYFNKRIMIQKVYTDRRWKRKIVCGDRSLSFKAGEMSADTYESIFEDIKNFLQHEDGEGYKRYKKIRIVFGPELAVRKENMRLFKEGILVFNKIHPVFDFMAEHPGVIDLYVARKVDNDHFAFGYPSTVVGLENEDANNSDYSLRFVQNNERLYLEMKQKFEKYLNDPDNYLRWEVDLDTIKPDSELPFTIRACEDYPN